METAMPQQPQPTARQRTLIAARSGSAIRTVDRAYRGENTYATTRERIVRAANDLGLPLPPEPQLPDEEALTSSPPSAA
jgi:hypothetical protein